MSSNEENTEMKMNCNMACKSNQNSNKQWGVAVGVFPTHTTYSSINLVRKQDFLANVSLQISVWNWWFYFYELCNSFKQVFCKFSSWLIKFFNISHQGVQKTFVPQRWKLQGNTAPSDGAEILSTHIYYTSENPCLLFFPEFCLPNKWAGEEISQSTTCAPLPVVEDNSQRHPSVIRQAVDWQSWGTLHLQ